MIGKIKGVTGIIRKPKPKFFFNDIENQQSFLDELYHKLNLKCLDDWTSISTKTFRELGAQSLLNDYYSNDKKKLLIAVYPHYPWHFGSAFISSWEYFQSLDNQREFMNKLYYKFQLKSLDEWTKVAKREIVRAGGRYLFCYYGNDFEKLLAAVYPSHLWVFPTKIPRDIYFQSIDNQREFMEKLFVKFQLKSLDDWLFVPLRSIYHSGGRLLLELYSNDMKKLLSSLYPLHRWDFEQLKISSKVNYFQSMENQRNFMERLFVKFNLSELEDWLHVPRRKLHANQGKVLLLRYYANDMHKLLAGIYPNYPWDFAHLSKTRKSTAPSARLSHLPHQRALIDSLYHSLGLSSLEEWKQVRKQQMIKAGGYQLLSYHYANDMHKLLLALYPHYPWLFPPSSSLSSSLSSPSSSVRPSPQTYFYSLENRREWMGKLFASLHFSSLDDFLKLSKKRLCREGGGVLLHTYYHNNYPSLLRSLYPFFPWDFEKMKKNSHVYFRSIDHQREYMDRLFSTLHFTSFNDWLSLTRSQLLKHGGASLLVYYYSNQLEPLLMRVYPNYPWSFTPPPADFDSLPMQRQFLDRLFTTLDLRDLDDWHSVKLKTIKLHGGHKLLRLYSFDRLKLFSTLYPHHLWRFTRHPPKQIKPAVLEVFKRNLRYILERFLIRKKADWYRLPVRFEVNIYRTLKYLYPDERWRRSLFSLRSKKSQQYRLFSAACDVFPSLLLLEDYHPPYLVADKTSFEYDIFIPALNIAFEYQGAQHYDDIPAVFPSFENCLLRDQTKIDLSRKHDVRIVYIPYWWDSSRSTLLSTITSAVPSLLNLAK